MNDFEKWLNEKGYQICKEGKPADESLQDLYSEYIDEKWRNHAV